MKAESIYGIAMSLMDERKDNGEIDTGSTKDYYARTPAILTALENEIAIRIGIGALDEVKSMNIELEDIICTAIMPYGLAGRLLAQEDGNLSNYFNSLYEEYINKFLGKYIKKSKQVRRTDVYNINTRVGE